jgi:hypothetical protein
VQCGGVTSSGGSGNLIRSCAQGAMRPANKGEIERYVNIQEWKAMNGKACHFISVELQSEAIRSLAIDNIDASRIPTVRLRCLRTKSTDSRRRTRTRLNLENLEKSQTPAEHCHAFNSRGWHTTRGTHGSSPQTISET